jgi:hypothetical protein
VKKENHTICLILSGSSNIYKYEISAYRGRRRKEIHIKTLITEKRIVGNQIFQAWNSITLRKE